MHVSSLSISGYRSLKDVSVNDIDAVSIIHGLNNSGKSNFLSAVETILAPKFQVETTTTVNRGARSAVTKTRAFHEGRIEHFRDSFYFNMARVVDFTITIDFRDEELKHLQSLLTKVPVQGATDIGQKLIFGDGESKKVKILGKINHAGGDAAEMVTNAIIINDVFQIYQRDASGKYHYLPNTGIEIGKSQEAIEDLLSRLTGCFKVINANRYLTAEPMGVAKGLECTAKNFKQWLFNLFMDREEHAKFQEIQTLFNSSPFGFGTLGFSNENGQIEIMVEKNGLRLPVTRVGSGLQQILFLIATTVFHRGKLLGIEELEINLSPRAQQEIFEKMTTFVMKSPQVLNQLIITSHSDYFGYRQDVKCFEVAYDSKNACSVIAPWNDTKQKKHFGRERALGGWEWPD